MRKDHRSHDSAEIEEVHAVALGVDGKLDTPGRVVTALLWPPIPTLEALPRLRSSFGAETNYLGEPVPAA